MKLKVGQKVRITQSDYLSLNGEGLVVGNTGTIRTLYPPSVYGVEVDNSTKPLSGDGEGWAFDDDELEAIPSPLAVARAKGEAGIQSSAQHAEADHPGWQQEALHYLSWYCRLMNRRTSPEFHIEAFRLWATAKGLKKPAELRSYGALTQRAIREKMIRPTGLYARAVSSNLSPKMIYVPVDQRTVRHA